MLSCYRQPLSAILLMLVVLTGCAQAPVNPPAPATEAPQVSLTLQLKWFPQAQFAGYYAALEQGYYAQEGLRVTIKPGGPDILAEEVVASGEAQFGIDWLASLLSARERGLPLVNIAQIFQFSGLREISWKERNIISPADFRGKQVAVWFGGNEYSLLATLNKYGLAKDRDVTLVSQPFDMELLLRRKVDAAAAMTYNELYQVMRAGHTLNELNIIDFNKEGTAMLEDGLFASEEWLRAPGNQELAVRFLRASLKGWEFCRDQVSTCVDFVLKYDVSGQLTRDAQEWQMSEVNKLIWGESAGASFRLGYMDPERFAGTAEIAQRFGITRQLAGADAYTHTIWEQAAQQ